MTSYLKSTPHPSFNSFQPGNRSNTRNTNPPTSRNDNNQQTNSYPLVKPDVYSVLEKASKFLNKKNTNTQQRVSATRLNTDLTSTSSMHSSISSISLAESEMPSDLSSSWEGSMIVIKNRQKSRSSGTILNKPAPLDKESHQFMPANAHETKVVNELNDTNAAISNLHISDVSACTSAHPVPLSASDKSTLNNAHVPASEPKLNPDVLQITAQSPSTPLVAVPASSPPPFTDSCSLPCSIVSSVQESVHSIRTESPSETSRNQLSISTRTCSIQSNLDTQMTSVHSSSGLLDAELDGSKETAYEEEGFEEYVEGDSTSIINTNCQGSVNGNGGVSEQSIIPNSGVSAPSSKQLGYHSVLQQAEVAASNHDDLLRQHRFQPPKQTITQSTSTTHLTRPFSKEHTTCKSTQTPHPIKQTSLWDVPDEISQEVPTLHQNETIVRQWIQDAVSNALASVNNRVPPASQKEDIGGHHQVFNDTVASNHPTACATCHPHSSSQLKSTPNTCSSRSTDDNVHRAQLDLIEHLIQFTSVPCHLSTTQPKRGLITLEKTLYDLARKRPAQMSLADAVQLVLKEEKEEELNEEQAINGPPIIPQSRWFQTNHCKHHQPQHTRQFVGQRYRPVDIWINRK